MTITPNVMVLASAIDIFDAAELIIQSKVTRNIRVHVAKDA